MVTHSICFYVITVLTLSYSKANDIFDMPRIHSNWIGAGMFKSDLLMKHLEPAQTTQLIGKTIIRPNSCPIIFILGVSVQCQYRASMYALTNTCLSTWVTLGEKCTAVTTTLYTSPKGTKYNACCHSARPQWHVMHNELKNTNNLSHCKSHIVVCLSYSLA